MGMCFTLRPRHHLFFSYGADFYTEGFAARAQQYVNPLGHVDAYLFERGGHLASRGASGAQALSELEQSVADLEARAFMYAVFQAVDGGLRDIDIHVS